MGRASIRETWNQGLCGALNVVSFHGSVEEKVLAFDVNQVIKMNTVSAREALVFVFVLVMFVRFNFVKVATRSVRENITIGPLTLL